jgi:HSP20 family molecular chaperone IbpA
MRSIPLGIDIDNEEIEAKFEDGILRVKAPKRDPESGPNRVEVN